MIEIDTDTNTQITPAPVESEKMTLAVVDFEEQATGLTVTSDADLPVASALLGGIKALRKEAEAKYRPNIKRWLAGHRAAIADLKEIDGPLEKLEKLVKGSVADYHADVYRKQEAAREAAEAEERRIAEAEARREREAAAAEVRRIAEEEARIAAAFVANERGDTETANAILDLTPEPTPEPDPEADTEGEPDEIAPAAVIPRVEAPAKVAGMSASKKYTATVEDSQKFAQWAFVCGRFDEFFAVKQSALNAEAKKDEESFSIPGCKLVVEFDVASRKV